MKKCPVCNGKLKIHAKEDGFVNIDTAGVTHDLIDCPTCEAKGVIEEITYPYFDEWAGDFLQRNTIQPLKDRIAELESAITDFCRDWEATDSVLYYTHYQNLRTLLKRRTEDGKRQKSYM